MRFVLITSSLCSFVSATKRTAESAPQSNMSKRFKGEQQLPADVFTEIFKHVYDDINVDEDTFSDVVRPYRNVSRHWRQMMDSSEMKRYSRTHALSAFLLLCEADFKVSRTEHLDLVCNCE